MSGDGVSMTTTLSQMGSVAKSQAQNQSSASTTTPFSEQMAKQDELKIQRVKETQESEEAKVKRENEDKDKRKRRRLKRHRKTLNSEADQDCSPEGNEEESQEEELGCLLDLRV